MDLTRIKPCVTVHPKVKGCMLRFGACSVKQMSTKTPVAIHYMSPRPLAQVAQASWPAGPGDKLEEYDSCQSGFIVTCGHRTNLQSTNGKLLAGPLKVTSSLWLYSQESICALKATNTHPGKV